MKKALILVFTFLFFTPTLSQAQQPMVVGAPCVDINQCEISEIKAVFQELYSRVGLSVTLKYLPMLRDITEADAGIIDGTMSRIPMATKDFPNLVQVPFPVASIELVAVSVKPGIRIHSWADLKNYDIGILRGNRTPLLIAEKHAIDITLFNNNNSGFAMLQDHRIDAIICDRKSASELARVTGAEKMYLSDTLFEGYSYHYLNKKHRALAPLLARELKKMLEDGTARKLLGKYQSWAPTLPLRPEKQQ